jgi:hypothetical protein
LPSVSRPGKRADRNTRSATALPVEAADDQTLSSTVARYGRVDLLCVNELGYLFPPPGRAPAFPWKRRDRDVQRAGQFDAAGHAGWRIVPMRFRLHAASLL